MISQFLTDLKDPPISYYDAGRGSYKDPLVQIAPKMTQSVMLWAGAVAQSLDPVKDRYLSSNKIALSRNWPMGAKMDLTDLDGIKKHEYTLHSSVDIGMSPVLDRNGTRVINSGHIKFGLHHNRGNYVEIKESGIKLSRAIFDFAIFASYKGGYFYLVDFDFWSVQNERCWARIRIQNGAIDIDESDLVMTDPPVNTELFLRSIDLYNSCLRAFPLEQLAIAPEK